MMLGGGARLTRPLIQRTIASGLVLAAGLWLGFCAIWNLMVLGRFETVFGSQAGPVLDGLLLIASPICLIAATWAQSRPLMAISLLLVSIFLTLAFYGISMRSIPPVGALLVAAVLASLAAKGSGR